MKRSIILILSAVLIAAILSGCVQELSDSGSETPDMAPTSQPNVTPSPITSPSEGVPSLPQRINLSISNAPALNQTTEVMCEMLTESTNTTTEIELPEGFELVSGNLTWNDGGGSVIVKAVKTGNWTITATTTHDVFTEDGILCHDWTDVECIHVAVREDTAWISETPFTEIPPLPPGPVMEPRVNTTLELPPMKTPSGTIITPKPVKLSSVPSFSQKINLSISNAPALNQTTEVMCEMLTESTNTTTEIELPEGFELVSGNLTWKDGGGSVTAKAVKTGNWVITATTTHDVFTEDGVLHHYWTDVECIHVDVREDTARVSETSFTKIFPPPPGPVMEPRVSGGSELSPFVDSHVNENVITPKPAPLTKKTKKLNGTDNVRATRSQSAEILYANCDIDLQIGEEGTCGNYKIRLDYWTAGEFSDYQIAHFHLWRLSPYADLGSDSLDVWYESEGKYYDDNKLHVDYTGSGGDPQEAHYELGDLTPGELTVTGAYRCWISENIFTGGARWDVAVPRIWAAVRIFDGNDNPLGNGLTGTDGRFSIVVTNPGATGFYVQTLPSSSACNVTKEDGSDYIGQSSTFHPLPSDATYDIGEYQVYDHPHHKGAWRIYETIVNDYYDRGAWDFLANEGPGYTPPGVNVTFPSDGTYYDLNYRIHIGDESHTKALDVVQHEYGHFIMHMIYDLYWPTTYCPHPHFINEFSHPNCAWTEGWANFFPLAVQNESNFELGNGDDVNLETKTWGTPNWDDGDGVEGRVAGALFDVYDVTDDGYDTFTDGFLNIWDVVFHQTDDNFVEFYAAWDARGHDVLEANAAIYQNTIDYNDEPDVILTSPNGGGWYCCIVTVEAMAADQDGTVSQVEFKYSSDSTNGVDGTWNPIGVDTSSAGGWSVDWGTSGISDPTVWVKARAWDNLGESSEWDPSDASFGVDNTVPPAPTISSTSHPDEDEWYSDDDPRFTWTTPSDISGIACYSYTLDQSATTTPDITCEPAGNSVWHSNVPDGSWYLHVRAKDNAGNWGGADHYRVKIDTENPPAPAISSSTHPDEGEWYTNNDPSFIWTTPSDTSGIDCYSYIFDQSATTTPDVTCDTTESSESYTDVADGTWYFHLIAKGNAGNWGSADHYRVKIGGEASTTDAAIALQLAASGGWDLDADVSGDGSVTSLDALMILQAAAGAIDL